MAFTAPAPNLLHPGCSLLLSLRAKRRDPFRRTRLGRFVTSLHKRAAFVQATTADTFGPISCIAKNAGAMARDLLKCYAGGAKIRLEDRAAQFTHN